MAHHEASIVDDSAEKLDQMASGANEIHGPAKVLPGVDPMQRPRRKIVVAMHGGHIVESDEVFMIQRHEDEFIKIDGGRAGGVRSEQAVLQGGKWSRPLAYLIRIKMNEPVGLNFLS
jgi:hypothetical protein